MWVSGCYARLQVGFIMRHSLFTSNCVALKGHDNPCDITVSIRVVAILLKTIYYRISQVSGDYAIAVF